jgi:hypothetical protein
MYSRAAISVLIAAQPLHGEQFGGNCVELFFKREHGESSADEAVAVPTDS